MKNTLRTVRKDRTVTNLDPDGKLYCSRNADTVVHSDG